MWSQPYTSFPFQSIKLNKRKYHHPLVFHVPILQFAGDMLQFCRYDDSMINTLINTIELFE